MNTLLIIKRLGWPLTTAVFLFFTLTLLWYTPPTDVTANANANPSWLAKIDPTLEQGATVDILVEFAPQANLSLARAIPNKAQRGAFVHSRLTAVANTSQADIQTWLKSQNLFFRSYAINNTLWIPQLPTAHLPTLAQHPQVAYIHANHAFTVPLPPAEANPQAQIQAIQAIEWGINKIGAPLVWAEGITGTSVVVGGQDTGYEWNHPALKQQYRGWDEATQTADHNYQWHDAIHADINGGGNPCGFNSPVPCDDYWHGTHTMGTMVGDDGGTNQIGVAPGARWIGCRNMEQGDGTPQTYIECFDWFLAPTDLAGANPRPDLAPDVINNSWGCPTREGCNSSNFALMETAVDNLRAAGVVVVVSAGNTGASGCSSVQDPAAIFANAFTVGNTMSNDAIAPNSSRGPVTNYGTRMKPDISAPGTNVRSAMLNGTYGTASGTSMAGPHVAGAVALLIAAEPSLRGDPDALQELLESTARGLTTTQGCGGDSSTAVPNNVFGHGRVDVWSAYQNLPEPPPIPHELGVSKTAPLTVTEGENITYTLTLTHFHPVSPTHNVWLTDTLPTHTTFVTATEPFSLTDGVVSWSWPSLEPTALVTVQLVVRPTAVLTVTNALYGVQHDGTIWWGSAVHTAVVTAPIEPPPPILTHTLALHKSAPETISPHQPLTYTLVLTHHHPTSPTHNLILTDTLPLSTTLLYATAPYTQDGQTIIWHWPSVAAQATITVTLAVLPDPLPQARLIRNIWYGAKSDEVPVGVRGTAVDTIFNPYTLYFPYFTKEYEE
jgi:serine protease AprX